MFTLKKLISAFLLPIPIGLFFLIISLIYLFSNSYKKAKFFLFLTFLWFALLSNQTISNAILEPLENEYKALLNTPKVNYILVLGNGHKSDENLAITSQLNGIAINRLVEGIRHYKNLDGAKLILSGYGGFDKNSHALMLKKLAISLGVDSNDIITLETPKDTQEEAVESRKILGTNSFILVTSASHIKRAMILFENEGLKPIASPTQHLSFEYEGYKSHFNVENLKKVETAFHEYLGLAWIYIINLI